MEQEIQQQSSNKQGRGQKQHVFLRMKHEELMKNRSYAKTIKAAWKVFNNNFATIFRHLWVYALALAGIIALYVMTAMRISSEPVSISAIITFAFLFILLIGVSAVFAGRADMLINPKSFLWNIGRVLKLYLLELVVMFIIGAIVATILLLCLPEQAQLSTQPQDIVSQQHAAMNVLKAISVLTVSGIVISLLLLPFVYVSMKYIADTETSLLKIVWSGYKTGMRYWGYIFLTFLIAVIAVFIPSLLISLPNTILNIAVGINDHGVTNGDPSGLPSYINVLSFSTALVTYFLLAFITVFNLFMAYYLYGTIETRQQERDTLTDISL